MSDFPINSIFDDMYDDKLKSLKGYIKNNQNEDMGK